MRSECKWMDIETAPKGDARIILCFPTGRVECGKWEADQYAKTPRPFWTGDLERVFGTLWYRANQPTHWMPLPKPPTT